MKAIKIIRNVVVGVLSLSLVVGLGSAMGVQANDGETCVIDNRQQATSNNNTSSDFYTWTKAESLNSFSEVRNAQGKWCATFPVLLTCEIDGIVYILESDYNGTPDPKEGSVGGCYTYLNNGLQYDYTSSSGNSMTGSDLYIENFCTKLYDAANVEGFSNDCSSFVSRGNLMCFYFGGMDNNNDCYNIYLSKTNGESSKSHIILYNGNSYCTRMRYIEGEATGFTPPYDGASKRDVFQVIPLKNKKFALSLSASIETTSRPHRNAWGVLTAVPGRGYTFGGMDEAFNEDRYQKRRDDKTKYTQEFTIWIGKKGVSEDILYEKAVNESSDASKVTYVQPETINTAEIRNGEVVSIPTGTVKYLPSGSTMTIYEGGTLIITKGSMLICNGYIKNDGLILVQSGGKLVCLDPNDKRTDSAFLDDRDSNRGDLVIRAGGVVRLNKYTSNGILVLGGDGSNVAALNITNYFKHGGYIENDGFMLIGFKFNRYYDAITVPAKEWKDKTENQKTEVKVYTPSAHVLIGNPIYYYLKK